MTRHDMTRQDKTRQDMTLADAVYHLTILLFGVLQLMVCSLICCRCCVETLLAFIDLMMHHCDKLLGTLHTTMQDLHTGTTTETCDMV